MIGSRRGGKCRWALRADAEKRESFCLQKKRAMKCTEKKGVTDLRAKRSRIKDNRKTVSVTS